MAVGGANLLVMGEAPLEETGFGGRKPHKDPGENSCGSCLLVEVAGCRLDRSCLCQGKPGPDYETTEPTLWAFLHPPQALQ